jgi:hypothetical protein
MTVAVVEGADLGEQAQGSAKRASLVAARSARARRTAGMAGG